MIFKLNCQRCKVSWRNFKKIRTLKQHWWRVSKRNYTNYRIELHRLLWKFKSLTKLINHASEKIINWVMKKEKCSLKLSRSTPSLRKYKISSSRLPPMTSYLIISTWTSSSAIRCLRLRKKFRPITEINQNSEGHFSFKWQIPCLRPYRLLYKCIISLSLTNCDLQQYQKCIYLWSICSIILSISN